MTYKRDKAKHAAYMRKRTRSFREQGLCVACGKVKTKQSRCPTCKAKEYKAASKPHRAKKAKLRRRKDLQEARSIVLDHYGNRCAWCGCTVKEFLSIDHINNDGIKDRHKHSGTGWYRHIISHQFPNDLQLLCYNCNCSKEFAKLSKEDVVDRLHSAELFCEGGGI